MIKLQQLLDDGYNFFTGVPDSVLKLFLERIDETGQVTCVEPNVEMLKQGEKKLKKFGEINWINAPD